MPSPPAPLPPFAEALKFWLKLGFISFGGPAGQIAILHKELVETRRWFGERHFLHALNFCMLLPGPEAQQLATYLGWRMHGVWGGIAAGGLFVLPSAFILFGLSWLYMAGGDLPWLAALFHGLLGAVIAVVLEAVIRIGKRSLHSPALWTLAVVSFVAIHFFGVSFVLIILAAAVLGGAGHGVAPRLFPAGKGHGPAGSDERAALPLPPVPPAGWGRNLRVAVACLTLWWAPILALGLSLGWSSVPAQQGLFFSKAALVTFGGAYAVLPYVAQQAVEHHGWLTHPQMMAGLALAETTPGPLIMVLQFVGFAGGWQLPGPFPPLGAAALGSAITTWVTFLPCFFFIFLGGPHVERLHTLPRLSAALTGITAAVVGVILNLGVAFTLHALWPEGGVRSAATADGFVALVAVAAFIALQRFKVGLIPVIGACALAGLLHGLVFSP
jgi:chromate transporter